MFRKLSAVTLLLGLMTLTPSFMNAAPPAQKKPVQNVSPKKHPNLARAQRQTENAFNSITAAQQANEFDLAGHAAKAKELLDQANQELKKAAEVSNINHAPGL
jgi:hypothetical protein